jgi:hypothetical protein
MLCAVCLAFQTGFSPTANLDELRRSHRRNWKNFGKRAL